MREFTAVLPVLFGADGSDRVPEDVPEPTLQAWEDNRQNVQVLNANFDGVEVHTQRPKEADLDDATLGMTCHFHINGGPALFRSPWDDGLTTDVFNWLIGVHYGIYGLSVVLTPEITNASSWYGQGFTFYPGSPYLLESEGLCRPVTVDTTEPLPLGQWPGTGHGDIRHAEDDSYDMWLLWNPEHVTPDRLLAKIRTTDGQVETELADAEWDAVGVSSADALEWGRVAYHNHLLIHAVEKSLLSAAVRVIAGLD